MTDSFVSLPQAKQTEIAWRFMNLYRSSARGHGWALRSGALFNETKNKMEINAKYAHTEAGLDEWLLHLRGERMLGLGPTLDDGTVWWGSIDVDKMGTGGGYDIDILEVMDRVGAADLPLVADRSKSGGLHLKVFFTEAVDAGLVQRGLKQWAAQLGLGGNEVFPKQIVLKDGDYSSYMFMPYGPLWDLYQVQAGLNRSGGDLTVEEYLMVAEISRVTRSAFADKVGSSRVDSGGSSPDGAKRSGRSTGKWTPMESMKDTIDDMFKGGPPCLLTLARLHVPNFQHNFLVNAITFLKRKYPDNWVEAIQWVNINVLRPIGDNERLRIMMRDHKDSYRYLCKDEPICGFCDADSCKRKQFGVGTGAGGMNGHELGLVIINRMPQIYIVNMGDQRIEMSAQELLSQKMFRYKCLEYGADFPDSVRQGDWDAVVRKARDEATVVDPPEILRTNIAEIETLMHYFAIHVPMMVRTKGEEFTTGRIGDKVRIKEEEQRIYFKWESLMFWGKRVFAWGKAEQNQMRMFINNNAGFNKRDEGKGWFRSSHWLHFGQLEEQTIHRWLHPEDENAAE